MTKIKEKIVMYKCSLCGKSDKKTIKEARDGKIVTICEDCSKEKKYLYCPKCRKYPDKIIEEYSSINEIRKWDGECYELIESDIDGQFQRSACPKCLSTLKEK